MKLFGSLAHRPFALLWGGQTISRLGDFTYQVALAWWVLEKTGSAAAMGRVMIFAFAPMLVFLLIGGVAVDRYPKVAVMLISDVLRGALVLSIAALTFGGHLQVWQVYVASLLFGFVDAFFNPAYTAAVPELVPARLLPSANALTSLSQQFGRVAGPPLGAGMVALAGTGWAFTINGLSFFASAACLLPLVRRRPSRAARQRPMPAAAAVGAAAVAESAVGGAGEAMAPPLILVADLHKPDESGPPRGNVFRDVAEGIGFVARTPWLWVTILTFTLANVLLAGPYAVSLPFLVKGRGRGGVGTLGLLYAMFPLGYAAAAATLGHRQTLRRRGLLIFGGGAVAGLMIVPFGLDVPVAALAVAAVLNGFALEVAGLSWTHLMQERVPAKMLGRVSSIDSLGSYALLPVGYALAGWATDRFGAQVVFLLGGGAATLVALIGLLSPAVREVD